MTDDESVTDLAEIGERESEGERERGREGVKRR